MPPAPPLQQQQEAGSGGPLRAKGRSRLPLILGVVAVAIVAVGALAMTGVVRVPGIGGGSTGGDLTFVPSTAALCAEVNLNGILKDAKPLEELPALIREAIKEASGKDVVKELESEVGVDFKKGIAPALPKEFVVAILPSAGGEPSFLLAGRPGDMKKAKALAEKSRKKAEGKGVKFTEQKHGGSVIVSGTEGPKGAPYAFTGSHVVLGSSAEAVEAALDARSDPAKRFGSGESVQGLRRELTGEADILVLLDVSSWMQVVGKMQGLGAAAGALRPGMAPGVTGPGVGGKGSPLQPGTLSAEQMELLKGTMSIVRVDFAPKGVEVENIDRPGEGLKAAMAPMAQLPPVDRGLLGRMPANPLALMAVTSPAQSWAAAKQAFASLPQMTFALEMVRGGLSKAGLDLERDILGWMKGTAAAGLYYDTKPFPSLVIAWDVADRNEVNQALANLTGAIGKVAQGQITFPVEQTGGATVTRFESPQLAMVPFLKPVFVLTDRTLYFASLDVALKSVLSVEKASAADAVTEAPKEAHVLGMFDFPAFATFVSDLGPVLATMSPGANPAQVQAGLKKAADLLNCLKKASGFSEFRPDGSSLERYSLPVDYETLVKLVKGWVGEIPAAPGAKAAPAGGGP